MGIFTYLRLKLRYLRLKFIVSLLRFLARPRLTPKPDDILQIPSRDSHRTIKAHVYRPRSSEGSGPSPVLLNFHGSGFVLRLHGSDDLFCRRIAQQTNYTVLDVQYRLAPEHPFPAAPNDVEDAVKYVLSQPSTYDATHVCMSGFSAGGNLALGVAGSPAFPKDTFRSVHAIYPVTDLSMDPYSKIAPDPSGPDNIPGALAKIFDESYVGNSDVKNPSLSPTFADVTRFPKNVLIVTCAFDKLALEAEKLADRIEQGGDVGRYLVRKRVPGVGHAWDKTTKPGSDGEEKRDEIYALVVEVLKR